MKRIAIVAVMILVCSGAAGAQSCYAQSYSYPVYAERVVVKKVAVPYAVYVPVQVPTYSSYYSAPPPAPVVTYSIQQPAPVQPVQPGYAAPAAAPACAGVADLIAEIQAIKRQLGQPAAPSPMPAPPKPTTPPVDPFNPPADTQSNRANPLPLGAGKCASCHAKGKESEGGSLVLLDGGRIPALGDRQFAKLVDVLTGARTNMPPAGNKYQATALTPEEATDWLAKAAAARNARADAR